MKRAALAAVVGAPLLAWAAMGAEPAAPGPAIQADALRARVEPDLCLVVPRNSWGVPLAYANGFLVAGGRYVVTDYGAIARPGVSGATLAFADGTAVPVGRFAAADAESGLVALSVEGPVGRREGLALAAEAPNLARGSPPVPVAVMGRQWGTDLALVTGTLAEGPSMKGLGLFARGHSVKGDGKFLRVQGDKRPAAGGSPVVTAAGEVVGVRIDVRTFGIEALAAPIRPLGQALAAGEPDPRPLAELPAPVWNAAFLRVTGPPADEKQMRAIGEAIEKVVWCPWCKGTGEIKLARGKVQCPECHGDRVVFTDDVYARLGDLAAEATRLGWTPADDTLRRSKVRMEGMDVLRRMTLASLRFHQEMGRLAGRALATMQGDVSRGVVLYGTVIKTATGPGGPYTVIEPFGADTWAVVDAEPTMSGSTPGPTGQGWDLKPGKWVVLTGVALRQFDLEGRRAVYVLPFGWVATKESR
jgi:hypothetical protein